MEVRKTIINKADRGVLSPRCHEEVAGSQLKIEEIFGKILNVKYSWQGVEIEIQQADAKVTHKFDYVVAAIGFDLPAPITQLLPNFISAETSSILEEVDHELPRLSKLIMLGSSSFENIFCLLRTSLFKKIPLQEVRLTNSAA